MIRESVVEKYLLARVANGGGIAEKVTVLGRRGFFDRLVAMPGGRIIFVEVKKPKGSRTAAHQRERHDLYRSLGCEVAVVKSLADVDFLIAGTTAAGVQIPLRQSGD